MAPANKLTLLSIFSLLIFLNVVNAQQSHYFKTGLVLNVGAKYGREAIYTDPLSYQLYTKGLKAPHNGETFDGNTTDLDLKWTSISADTTNRFRIRGAASSYLYLNYQAETGGVAILNITGNSAVYVNSVPHMGDPYSLGWMNIPIVLKKGNNDFYVRGANVVAKLTIPDKPVFLDIADATLPSIVSGKTSNNLQGAVVVINTEKTSKKRLKIKAELSGNTITSNIQEIPALSTRKVYFSFNGEAATERGFHELKLTLINEEKQIDQQSVKVERVEHSDKYAKTFVSNIDGSLQYYAVAPQVGGEKPGSALFFSVHGAGVEAIGQAKAYQSKDWGSVVTPTNRRPRGFNWEDWGRLDALEVLTIAKSNLKPDPKNIYLTGHSMGGHGTWFLGATYPDKWAAIAPCAGYPTLKGYGSADGLIPDTSTSNMGQILLRASNQSDVPKLAFNYKSLGVYILHGDADRTVSVNYARQMKQQLSSFHTDMSYYEYPGGSHWYGDHSVDWLPIFDFFKWHTIAKDEDVNSIDFTTASPGISASNRWISINQQINPLSYSRVQVSRDLEKGLIKAKTENIQLLKIKLNDFKPGVKLQLSIDSIYSVNHTVITTNDSIFLEKNQNSWSIAQTPKNTSKGPHRYGTLKDGFNKKMVYVYGTSGTPKEKEWSINKARFDAESWYYRGNGAFDIVADKDYTKAKFAGRNVILIGNAETNSAWKTLLADCPIQVTKGVVKAGAKEWKGTDLGAYFVWPIAGTIDNSVSVISGTGILGMQGVTANQYFAGGSGFPDIMIYRLKMLTDGVEGVEYAGFFDQNWKIDVTNTVAKR